MSEKSVKKNIKKINWGVEKTSLLDRYLSAPAGGGVPLEVIIHSGKQGKSPLRVIEREKDIRIEMSPLLSTEKENDPALKAAPETRIREAMGSLIAQIEKLEPGVVTVHIDLSQKWVGAALTGLEIALYRFRKIVDDEEPKFKLELKSNKKALNLKALGEAILLGQSVNLARHLTNLPPNWLHPVSYAEFVVEHFRGVKNVKVEVWDEKRLAAENMHLHLDVGKGSESPPRLVRLRYQGAAASKGPVALVGKGITFDTGGLDIKSSSSMRLMKKDMGGSAVVVGIAQWAALAKIKVNLDCYLALAENAISSNAFRPSDIITGRNGLQVEIHNTDAEGRLVLADALDVAVTQKQKPRAVIDIATLTGAIKAGLGSQIAGLFGNDVKLTRALQKSGQTSGDLNWPMPLYQKYRSQMSSNFADMVNSPDGFGGAVTAALFLEKFVGEIPWAHFDIYAWKDSPDGAQIESGGSGQGVLCLADWLSSIKA